MSRIRFLKLSSFYPDYLVKFRSSVPGIESLSFAEYARLLFDDCFAWSDFWKTNLERTGLYEAEEVVLNDEVYQQKWAAENNVPFGPEWESRISLAQIELFKPDVIFINDVYNYHSLLEGLKAKFPFIKLVIGWDGILYHRPEVFKDCDIVLSCVRQTVTFYENAGFKAHYFPLSFEKTILDKLHPQRLTHNVTFIGSVVLIKGYHEGRLRRLAELSSRVKLDFFTPSFPSSPEYFSKVQLRRLIDGKFLQYFDIIKMTRLNQGERFGKEMFQLMRDSKFVFNTHGDQPNVQASNMRLTEATGVGSCLVTDWKENISEFFVPDQEIVTYKTIAEAADKIRYLLEHEEERKKIALAGQRRTLKEYSYQKRIKEFSDYLINELS